MAIITLTSDMGTSDHYVAAVKAAVLSQAPDAILVDITHDVNPFDIHHAAFLLRSVWADFPIGTVHIVGVKPELSPQTPHVVVHYMGHYFVGADTGVFSLILDEEPESVWEINLPQGTNWKFPMKGVFATAAAHLSRGGLPQFLGSKIQGIQHTMAMQPVIDENLIKCSVVHLDSYGNVYTNLQQSLFEKVRRGRSFSIHFKRNLYDITKISDNFDSALEGERLAMWASNGSLMIAINGGSEGHGGGAATLFGFAKNDIIRIEFYVDPNSEDDI
jgi:S-adenosylmethionine hydrolase